VVFRLLKQRGYVVGFGQVALDRNGVTAHAFDGVYRCVGVFLGGIAVVVHHDVHSACGKFPADQPAEVLSRT